MSARAAIDVPGTYVFDAAQSRQGYPLNKLAGARAGFINKEFDQRFLDAIESDPLSLRGNGGCPDILIVT
jgi:hypothetical protein